MHGCGPRNFVQPCLLLLLSERPAHGYDLIERLKPFGVADGDPGTVYRGLRALERGGLVRSTWQPSTSGPARRSYELTPEGFDELNEWLEAMRRTRSALDYYLSRCGPVVERRALEGTARSATSERSDHGAFDDARG